MAASQMKSSNPVFGDKAFGSPTTEIEPSEAMTIGGTVNRAAVLLGCVLLAAAWTWFLFYNHQDHLDLHFLVGAIGGCSVAVITVLRKTWASITGPIYALLEGLCLGALSADLEAQLPGVAIEAVGLTFAICFFLLFAYRSGFIVQASRLKRGVVAAAGGIVLICLSTNVLHVLDLRGPSLFQAGLLGLLIHALVIYLAALSMVIDFDFIEQSAQCGAPKYMEWYAAFGLIVTLVWLYLQFLTMLSKARQRQ